jgi:hypothetical protein
MSYDLAVWHTSRRLTNEEAGKLYSQLCDNVVTGVEPHAGIETFYTELTTKHPQIDDVPDDKIDDADLCPWSIAFDRSPGHLIMPCVWSKAEYVDGIIRTLARKHGLAVFDPQSGTISYPDSPPSPAAQPSQNPWWRFW